MNYVSVTMPCVLYMKKANDLYDNHGHLSDPNNPNDPSRKQATYQVW